MRLDALFTVKNGIPSSAVKLLDSKQPENIPFIRPASTQQRTIAGWVRKTDIKPENIFPRNTLFVSTNGEGSHTYAYVSSFEFVPNSDVAVLLPNMTMSLEEKIYYARCITMNRHKFSFGRKPKGERLKQLELPSSVPNWVKPVLSDDCMSTVLERLVMYSGKPRDLENIVVGYDTTMVDELFDVAYGTSLELVRLERDLKGINFISRTAKNNGVSARIKKLSDISPIEGPAITVALGGSVLESFLQIEPFYSGFHIFCLKPKAEMTLEEMLFYCACIRANKFRYSYGRQANRTLKSLRVPTRESIPSWVYGSIRSVVEKQLTFLCDK